MQLQPTWSFSHTGTRDAIVERIRTQTPPNDEANGKQFAGAQAFMLEILSANPAKTIKFDAAGAVAHDGRCEISIKIEPINLTV